MTLGVLFSRLDRLQHDRGFKLAATIVLVLAAAIGGSAYVLSITAPDRIEVAAPTPSTAAADAEATPEDQERSALDTTARVLNDVLAARADPTRVLVAIGLSLAVGIVVVWLGLGLTYLGLLALAAGIAWPLAQFESTAVYARLLVGVVVLTASFTALMQGLRVLLGSSRPVTAIARNVLIEATRMKVSLVFIVLLVFGLAALPGILDPDTPLRYRVQSFLQYSLAGSFWLIAVLTLIFSTSTLAAEQRDKVIWQTVTKPVSALQYILGKWLGVVALNAALLVVCTSGVFLFVEYLRSQPALGERVAYTATSGAVAEDRLLLETQVLAARRTVEPVPITDRNSPAFMAAVEQFVDERLAIDPSFAPTSIERERVADDLFKSLMLEARSLAPGEPKRFVFEDVNVRRGSGDLVTLKYRIETGVDRPDVLYRVTFILPETGAIITESSALGQAQTLQLLSDAISEDKTFSVDIYNGEMLFSQSGAAVGIQPNQRSVTIPEGSLVLSYPDGSYQANFLRGVFVLWLKLAFLAMLAIAASTFLSFSVASLVAIGIFLMAESSGFLAAALETFSYQQDGGDGILPHKFVAYWVSKPVAEVFTIYDSLNPARSLVDGVLITPASVATGTIALAVATTLLFIAAVVIFRRRELATYSGQ